MPSSKKTTKSTVMVTGATGYVAGWIVKDLLDGGHTVHAPVRNPDDADKLQHLRACSHHVNSQPTALKKFRHSIGVNIWQTSPIAFQTSSKVLAPAFLR